MTKAGVCLIVGMLAVIVVSCSGVGSPANTPTPQPVALDIAVFNDTESRPTRQVEIWIRGDGSWYPNLTFGSDSRKFSAYPIGESHEFYLYPDGRDGTEIQVEFQMTGEMISGSDRARMFIEISDTSVVVSGEAIPGMTQTYQR